MRPNSWAIGVILDVLAKEFPGIDDPTATDEKIKRSLSRRLMRRQYDQASVDTLRCLHNEICREIGLHDETGYLSVYYRGCSGGVASATDFDVDRFARDITIRYPAVPPRKIKRHVAWLVFTRYVM